MAVFCSVVGLALMARVPAFPSATSPQKELLFEPNRGQAAPEVQFIGRTSAYTLLLKHSEAMMLFKNSRLAVGFQGANQNATLSGQAAGLATVNYLLGSDPSSWKHGISTYRKVLYESLYPGIDVVFYGRGSLLEYDFVVHPGADPSCIVLAIKSSARPLVSSNGDLVIQVGKGELRFHAPVLHQLSTSSHLRARYVVHRDSTVSLAIDPYDRSKELVIDPVVSYSSYLGGTDDEGIFGIQRDRDGNLYVSGETSSVNFPTRDPVQRNEGGDYDAFVSKFDPTGTHLIYSTYLGGSKYDHAVGLAVDPSGDAYVAGLTSSPNFPTKNALQAVLKGKQSAFIAHLTHSGSEFVFSTYLGGTAYDVAQDITIDERSNIYITGITGSPDFPVTPGAFQTVCDGLNGPRGSFCSGDAFVVKLPSDGSRLIYSTFLGGSSFDDASGIAVDKEGAAYITGQSGSTDFPVLRPIQSKLAGYTNAFVSKLNPAGNKLEFSTYLGGSQSDGGTAIALGPEDDVYLTGFTLSPNFPLAKPFQAINRGGYDCFVTKLSRNGRQLLRSTYFGGSDVDFPVRLAVDVFGSVSVIGFTQSKDLAVKNAVQPKFGGGSSDAFALKLLPRSFQPLYATYFGGNGDEYGYGIHSEKYGQLWFGGSTSSVKFPIRNAFQPTYAGGPFDAFLTRLDLTIPDYFRILEDLVTGDEFPERDDLKAKIATAKTYSIGSSQEAVAALEQLDATLATAAETHGIEPAAVKKALAASHFIQEGLKTAEYR